MTQSACLLYLVNLYCTLAMMGQMRLLRSPRSPLPEHTTQLSLSSLATFPMYFQKVTPGPSCSGSSKLHPLFSPTKVNLLALGGEALLLWNIMCTHKSHSLLLLTPNSVIAPKILGLGKLKLEKVQEMYLFYSVNISPYVKEYQTGSLLECGKGR